MSEKNKSALRTILLIAANALSLCFNMQIYACGFPDMTGFAMTVGVYAAWIIFILFYKGRRYPLIFLLLGITLFDFLFAGRSVFAYISGILFLSPWAGLWGLNERDNTIYVLGSCMIMSLLILSFVKFVIMKKSVEASAMTTDDIH